MLDKEKTKLPDLPIPAEQSPWSAAVTWIKVSDDLGNSIDAPSLGSWTLNELNGVKELSKDCKTDVEFVYKAVRFFYEKRGANVDTQVGNLDDVPAFFVQKIWSFFTEENKSKDVREEEKEPGKQQPSATSTGNSKRGSPIIPDSPAPLSPTALSTSSKAR